MKPRSPAVAAAAGKAWHSRLRVSSSWEGRRVRRRFKPPTPQEPLLSRDALESCKGGTHWQRCPPAPEKGGAWGGRPWAFLRGTRKAYRAPALRKQGGQDQTAALAASSRGRTAPKRGLAHTVPLRALAHSRTRREGCCHPPLRSPTDHTHRCPGSQSGCCHP